MAKLIVIDPGHGRTGNPYPPQKGYYEGTQMWKLANYLKAELEKYGFKVITTRPSLNDDPSLSARGQTAGKNNAAMFISLHSNAPASAFDTKPTGSVVYYSLTDSKNKVFADLIGKKVSEVMGHHYRGSLTRQYPNKPGVDYYGVIRAAAQSGCKAAFIVEHGFHTNIKDSSFLIDDTNLQKLALEEAKVIAQYFGQETKENPPQVKPEPLDGFLVKVTANGLNIRKGAGTNYKVNGVIRDKGTYTIVETKGNWGRLKSGVGWIHLGYTEKINSPTKPSKQIKVGSKVKVRSGAKSYTGGSVASFIYKNVYTVDQLKDNRAVLDMKGICTPFKTSDLILQ